MTRPTPAAVAVRPAEERDLPAILAIYNDAVLNTTAVYDEEPATLEARRAWFAAKLDAGHPVYVAHDGGPGEGEVLGWSSYGPFRPWPGYRHTVEHSVYVAPHARGRGVGKALLPPLLQHARARGMHVMVAGIDADNEASLRLHAALGFERVAHFRQVGRKFGRWLDLVFMQRLLEE